MKSCSIAYVNTIFKCFGLTDTKSAQTPMEVRITLSDTQFLATHTQNEDMQDIPHQQGIETLMYAATSTHPDTSFAVATISQFMRNPRHAHWEATKCVLCDLKGTSEFGLTLGSSEARLEAYIDTDWASQPH
jgi:hypothetical protein